MTASQAPPLPLMRFTGNDYRSPVSPFTIYRVDASLASTINFLTRLPYKKNMHLSNGKQHADKNRAKDE